MNDNAAIQKYVESKKELYANVFLVLDNPDISEDDFSIFFDFVNTLNFEENKEDFKHFLLLLIDISNNHRREEGLFNKIEKILLYLGKSIKQTFSNSEIFDFFKSNKVILLFLIKNEIITMNEIIYNEIISITEKNGIRYCHFFYPEISTLVGEDKSKNIRNELLIQDSNIFNNFDENRQNGENDSYICLLIRQDSVEEFIKYVNKHNVSLKSRITPSIFETNQFLIENTSTLIEYAAFFGSIQIFQFLIFNQIELNPSIWLYAIHGKNGELIHILEENGVFPIHHLFDGILAESIKCHHNDIADYIENNKFITKNNESKSDDVVSNIFHYHNYSYFPIVFNNNSEFFYLYYYGYCKLFNLLLGQIESKEISKKYLNYL